MLRQGHPTREPVPAVTLSAPTPALDWRSADAVPSSLPMPELFLGALRPGMRVLDVGCGEAWIGCEVERCGVRYVGVDVNRASLARASSRRLVVAGEGGRLPFGDRVFDMVMLRAVLTVLVDEGELADVLREAFRVCRGVVGIQDFLQTWENPVYSARYEEGLRLTGRHGVFPVREGGTLLYWARHFTLDELSGLIAQAGGDVAEVVEGPSPTRSGNLIRGVALLASPQV